MALAAYAGGGREERLKEGEDGAAAEAEGRAGDLRRGRGEPVNAAHIAPEAPQEDLEATVLERSPGLALHEPEGAVHRCTAGSGWWDHLLGRWMQKIAALFASMDLQRRGAGYVSQTSPHLWMAQSVAY